MLTSGEAEFEVVHEPKRPFRVFAGSAEAVDIGTQFDVRLEHDSTVVTVVEGRVAVGPSSMLHGQGTDSSQEPLARFVELVRRPADHAWRRASGRPRPSRSTRTARRPGCVGRSCSITSRSGAVATEFNRYASKPIEIATPALRDLEISGVFATDDTDGIHRLPAQPRRRARRGDRDAHSRVARLDPLLAGHILARVRSDIQTIQVLHARFARDTHRRISRLLSPKCCARLRSARRWRSPAPTPHRRGPPNLRRWPPTFPRNLSRRHSRHSPARPACSSFMSPASCATRNPMRCRRA